MKKEYHYFEVSFFSYFTKQQETISRLDCDVQWIMVIGPNTSWQVNGEKMEMVTDFIFLGSKITVDGDCSHEL